MVANLVAVGVNFVKACQFVVNGYAGLIYRGWINSDGQERHRYTVNND
jgi:hypothetical protein